MGNSNKKHKISTPQLISPNHIDKPQHRIPFHLFEKISVEKVTEPGPHNFLVKGKNYYSNRLKICADSSVFNLIGCYKINDVSKISLDYKNVGHIIKENEITIGLNDFIFCVNFFIRLSTSELISYIIYFRCNKSVISSDSTLNEFFTNQTMSDAIRNNMFKIIPKIVDGNMIIRMAVGDNKPCLIGNKVDTYYILKPNYFEVCIDIASSSVAINVVDLALKYSNKITVDIGFCLENSLPEKLLGVCRFDKV
jgi:hypothetical protein